MLKPVYCVVIDYRRLMAVHTALVAVFLYFSQVRVTPVRSWDVHHVTSVVIDSSARLCLFVVLIWSHPLSELHTLSLHNPMHIIWWNYKYLLDYPFFFAECFAECFMNLLYYSAVFGIWRERTAMSQQSSWVKCLTLILFQTNIRRWRFICFFPS